jgi:predicted GNAT family acetyltransferase
MDSTTSESTAIRDNPAAQRLELQIDGAVAYAQYQLSPGAITFTHTLVPQALRGRGLGTRLVEAGLALARERGLKVIPVCPFFVAYLRAHPQPPVQA